MNRRAKSCGKDGRKAPFDIPSGFPLSHSFNNNKLDDRDHFQQNAKTSVASLRGLIGSSRNSDRHHSGMLIGYIGIPIFGDLPQETVLSTVCQLRDWPDGTTLSALRPFE